MRLTGRCIKLVQMIEKIEWLKFTCDLCGRSWYPREEGKIPDQCAKCRRRDWNKSVSPAHRLAMLLGKAFRESGAMDLSQAEDEEETTD